MSGGSLSSRVKNMKFMQVAGDKHRKQQTDMIEQENTKKLKDLSEWSLPVSVKTLKVIKAKQSKIRKVGYSTISNMGPTNITGDVTSGVVGRKTLSNIPKSETTEESSINQTNNEEVESDIEKRENLPATDSGKSKKSEKKSSKNKKQKKSKKSKIMDGFHVKSDDEFDPTEVDLTSKSLLDLWKANKK